MCSGRPVRLGFQWLPVLPAPPASRTCNPTQTRRRRSSQRLGFRWRLAPCTGSRDQGQTASQLATFPGPAPPFRGPLPWLVRSLQPARHSGTPAASHRRQEIPRHRREQCVRISRVWVGSLRGVQMILGARELLTEGDGLSNLQPESSYPIGYVSRNFGMLIRAGLDRDTRSICAEARGIRISTNQAVT